MSSGPSRRDVVCEGRVFQRHRPRETEIAELQHHGVHRDQEVLGLDVAMNHLLFFGFAFFLATFAQKTSVGVDLCISQSPLDENLSKGESISESSSFPSDFRIHLSQVPSSSKTHKA